MNVKMANDPARNAVALENRCRFFEREKVTGRIFIPYLVHGSNVALVTVENCNKMIRADGFVTKIPGIVLTVTIADCFPIYFYDPIRKAIGLAHSGWRGTVKNVVGKTVEAFAANFGSHPEDIIISIGPGIQKCHFEVSDEIIGQFENYADFITMRGKKYFIDLRALLLNQAEKMGIKKIEATPECTYCLDNDYFSYRRDKPTIPEVMVGYIGMI